MPSRYSIDLMQLEAEALKLQEGAPTELLVQFSMAISLKKIADLLTNPETLKVHLDVLANHPMNNFGEGFSAAIQNAIVRGNRGIDY